MRLSKNSKDEYDIMNLEGEIRNLKFWKNIYEILPIFLLKEIFNLKIFFWKSLYYVI